LQEITTNPPGQRVRALHPNTTPGLRPEMQHVDGKARETMGPYFLPIT
jgi:hypothetical protein